MPTASGELVNVPGPGATADIEPHPQLTDYAGVSQRDEGQ